MMKRKRYKLRKAQTFAEYVLLLGIVSAIYVAMTPLLRRGIQAMVKGVADQIGNQVNADDGITKDSQSIYANSLAMSDERKTLLEWQGDIGTVYNDTVKYQKESKSFLMFSDFVNETE